MEELSPGAKEPSFGAFRNLMKISVVTPSYNQAQFLEETVKSVLDQENADLEYVIIDGGSSDASQEIIIKHEDQLHYWVK